MRFIFILIFLNTGLSFLFGTKKLNILDKNHVKNYVDSWVNIWKSNPNQLLNTRINEAISSVSWCSKYKYNDNCYCFSYEDNNYLIFLIENYDSNILNIAGILESPENTYTLDQVDKMHNSLVELANNYNYTLNYKLLKKWSHGYYFYKYQN